jgi:hypothetical protein
MGWTVQGSNPGGDEIFHTCPDRPGAHPASCTVGTGSFPGIKSCRVVMLTPHPLLVPWSWKGRAIPLPPYGLYDLYRAPVPVQGCTLLCVCGVWLACHKRDACYNDEAVSTRRWLTSLMSLGGCMLCCIVTDATTTHTRNFRHFSPIDMAPPYSRRTVTSDSGLLVCESCLLVVHFLWVVHSTDAANP